jgi:hypothetical protein
VRLSAEIIELAICSTRNAQFYTYSHLKMNFTNLWCKLAAYHTTEKKQLNEVHFFPFLLENVRNWRYLSDIRHTENISFLWKHREKAVSQIIEPKTHVKISQWLQKTSSKRLETFLASSNQINAVKSIIDRKRNILTRFKQFPTWLSEEKHRKYP